MAKKPKRIEEASPDELPPLSISPDKVCFVIVKAREFDAKDIVTDPDDGSNPSDDDMIAMVREAGADVLGDLHCFAGSPALFEAGVEAGWYVSFSGLLTFPSYATKELAALVPSDRLLIETDAPYLAPVPHRGKPNRPAWVPHVGQFIADLRDVTVADIAAATTA